MWSNGMTEQNPYEQLRVTESSSFEDIQAAKSRLRAEYEGNEEQLRKIDSAYDAVLMDRLRLRQEGKIKVPDRIRFPEKLAEPPASPKVDLPKNSPAWIQSLVDTPSRSDILLPLGVATGLSALVIFAPTAVQIALIGGVGSTFYFLYRKERKLGRAVLLTVVGLLVGLLVGGFAYGLVAGWFAHLPIRIGSDIFASVLTFLIFWLVSSFLR
jgi:hypothetical protein